MVIQTDMCVIGAGSGGLSIAVGAVQMGAKVVLIEAHKMGGECLNTGCVPSKALLAAASHAHQIRQGENFGIVSSEPSINFQKVNAYVHSVIKTIAPHDSIDRMESLGIQVIRGTARFLNKTQVVVGDHCIQAKRFVIATGSSPCIPPVSGLDRVPYFTNETLFTNDQKLDHLMILGGGPIGVEMAQAHRRLGCQVSLFQRSRLLPQDDPEAVEVLRQSLLQEGVVLHEGAQVGKITQSSSNLEICVHYEKAGEFHSIKGSHLLVAAGRKPNLQNLDLEKAEVAFTPKGIQVNPTLRTTNKKIYALGDVTGGPLFTHWAGYQAGIILKNSLFGLPGHLNLKALPWVTYTDPELAQVGLNQISAERDQIKHRVLKMNFSDNDRAQAEGNPQGFVKALVSYGGKVLGATIVGSKAGELIAPWALAVSKGLSIGDLATCVLPYPTRSELSKKVAGSFYTPKIFGKTSQRVVQFLMRFKG